MTTTSSYLPAAVPADPRKTAALWADTRFIVIDTETTKPPKGGGTSLRMVSIAAVTCRKGLVRQQWQWLIDPGCPIDPKSESIHHITDEMVEGEPTFADRANDIIELFTEADGERRVIVGFNVAFDIAVIRYELELLHLTIPPVTILDTRGELATLAGLPAGVRNLAGVAAHLGITNTNPHEALGDAVATARVLIEQFERVAALDHTDLEELLVKVGGPTTAQDIAAGAWISDRTGIGFVAITKEHAVEHSHLLPARPSNKRLKEWQHQLATCAQLRCSHIVSAVEQATAPLPTRIDTVEGVLAERIAAGDAAGAATVATALFTLLRQHHAAMTPRDARNSALRWAAHWGPLFDSIGNCESVSDSDLCPACRNADPCPLDLWTDTVARCAYRPHGKSNDAFFAINGVRSKDSTYLRWIHTGIDHRIADAGMWVMCEHLTAIDQAKSAGMTAFHAVRTGCRHPGVAVLCADGIAAGGRLPRLDQAIALCDDILTGRSDSTLVEWDTLQHRRDKYAGLAARLRAKVGTDPETGLPIERRRHEPSREHIRVRVGRFSVTGPTPVEMPDEEIAATPDPDDTRAVFMAAVNVSLAGSYNGWGIDRWWQRPRVQLDGRAPLDIVSADDFTPNSKDAHTVRLLADRLVGPGAAT